MNDGFCMACGMPVRLMIPGGDNRHRKVCSGCGFIHYENPKNVVGCLLEWQGRVLLCRRAIEPRHGYWTLPAGFLENEESTIEGATREAYEEAMARCDDLRLFSVYSLPRISQVYLMFIGQLRDGYARASQETLEVGLFDEAEIPWDELAFPVVTEALMRYFEQRGEQQRGEQGAHSVRRVHSADILSRPGAPLEIVRHPH
jgi:ADP-ribose pyrophosphatase YjhB (NUDIX family)